MTPEPRRPEADADVDANVDADVDAGADAYGGESPFSHESEPPFPYEGELPFFVYGTLRPGESNHAAYLRGRVTAAEPARLPGAVLYDGPGYPYAVEDPQSGPVQGDLVTARPAEHAWLLRALDVLEDYRPGDPRSLYERVVRDVVRRDGTTARAWVYVAAPAVAARLRARGVVIEGGDWRARRRGGAQAAWQASISARSSARGGSGRTAR